jgi:hypothetical protein
MPWDACECRQIHECYLASIEIVYVLSSLALIIAPDLPAPLASIFRFPPLDLHAYFTLWQQHLLANILFGRPAILTRHLITSAGQDRHRRM